MNAMDRLMRETLTRTAADDDVHVERLLARARTRGLRYRRRRRLAAATGAVTAMLAIALVAAVLAPAGDSGGPAQPAPSATPTFASIPTGPPVPGAASPLDSPAALDDRTLIHLWVDGTPPFAIEAAGYIHEAVSESMNVTGRADGRRYEFTVTATRYQDLFSSPARPQYTGSHPASIGGRPATVYTGGPLEPPAPPDPGAITAPSVDPSGPRQASVIWSPAAGLWLEVAGRLHDEPSLLALAERVRLDRAFRCGPSFHLPTPPPGLQWGRCELDFKKGETDSMIMSADSPAGGYVFTTYNARHYPAWQDNPSPGAPSAATLNGRPVVYTRGGEEIEVRNGDARLLVWGPDKQSTAAVAGTVQLGDISPSTWPSYGP